jgi:hypothetical protein
LRAADIVDINGSEVAIEDDKVSEHAGLEPAAVVFIVGRVGTGNGIGA